MLGVTLARSASGQRWPEPGEAVNLIVSGTGERLGRMLRQPDQRDTAAVLAIAGPLLLAAAAVRTMASPFLFTPAETGAVPPRTLVTAVAFAVWWMLVALAGMLRWRRVAATGACLGLAGQVFMLVLTVSGDAGPLMVAYWQVAVALVAVTSALGSLRSQGRPLSWWAVTALAAAAAVVAGWPAAEMAFVRYTPVTAHSGTISDPLSGIGGMAERRALRRHPNSDDRRDRRAAARGAPAGRRPLAAGLRDHGAGVLGVPGLPAERDSVRLARAEPVQWQALVLVPVIGVITCFIGLRLYERLLRRREPEKQADAGRVSLCMTLAGAESSQTPPSQRRWGKAQASALHGTRGPAAARSPRTGQKPCQRR